MKYLALIALGGLLVGIGCKEPIPEYEVVGQGDVMSIEYKGATGFSWSETIITFEDNATCILAGHWSVPSSPIIVKRRVDKVINGIWPYCVIEHLTP